MQLEHKFDVTLIELTGLDKACHGNMVGPDTEDFVSLVSEFIIFPLLWLSQTVFGDLVWFIMA